MARQPLPELHYEMLSETSEESTVANSSDLWKKHTLKLLYERYPQEMLKRKRKYRRQGEPIQEPIQEIVVIDESEGEDTQIWVVNVPMIKTLENRREEMLRLQKEAVLLSRPPT